VIVIQEGKVESSKGKNLWDPSFDVPTHGEHTFLPIVDKDRLMANEEDQLYRDCMKQIGQAFAIGCLVISKTRARKAAEDQTVQENLGPRKKMEHLQSELQHLNGLLQEAERLQAEKSKEAAGRAQEAASVAEERNTLLVEVDKLKGS